MPPALVFDKLVVWMAYRRLGILGNAPHLDQANVANPDLARAYNPNYNTPAGLANDRLKVIIEDHIMDIIRRHNLIIVKKDINSAQWDAAFAEARVIPHWPADVIVPLNNREDPQYFSMLHALYTLMEKFQKRHAANPSAFSPVDRGLQDLGIITQVASYLRMTIDIFVVDPRLVQPVEGVIRDEVSSPLHSRNLKFSR